MWIPAISTGRTENSASCATPDESYHGVTYTREFRQGCLYHQGAGAADARLRHVPLRAGRIPAEPGAGDAGRCGWSATAATRNRWPHFLASQPQGGVCQLSRPGRQTKYHAAGTKIPARRAAAGVISFSIQGRPGGGGQVHGQPAAGQQRGACGRHLHLRAASGQQHRTASSPTSQLVAAGITPGLDPPVRGAASTSTTFWTI